MIKTNQIKALEQLAQNVALTAARLRAADAEILALEEQQRIAYEERASAYRANQSAVRAFTDYAAATFLPVIEALPEEAPNE